MSQHCRVLIIEDDATVAHALTALLRMMGHEVVAVQTAAAGLAALDSFLPDCVVLDLVLPDDNGLVVLRELRCRSPRSASAAAAQPKVAIVTALKVALEHTEVAELEPDAIFRKPVDVHSLVGWVGSCTHSS